MPDEFKKTEYQSIREHVKGLTVSRSNELLERGSYLQRFVWDGEEFELAGNYFNRLKIRARIAAYNAKQGIRNRLLEKLLTTLIKKLDKNDEKWLRRLAKGDTFLGKVIFGFLDVSQLPNFHEILKAVNKQYPDATPTQKAVIVFKKIDWPRTLSGIAAAIAMALGL